MKLPIAQFPPLLSPRPS